MTTSIENFTIESQLTTSAADVFSTAGSEKRFISSFVLTNTSSSNVDVTLWLLETATVATSGSGGNWIVNVTVPSNKAVKVGALIGHVLGTGQKVQGLASVDAVINVNAAGTLEV